MIDAHIHFAAGHPDCERLLERLDVLALNVCVPTDSAGGWRDQATAYRALAASAPRRFAWCTAFDLPRFDDPHYADRVIEGLAADIAAGAVACKIWKNIGMEVRHPDGAFFMVDDPLLDPILDYLQDQGLTLLTHIGEPLACWLPLDPANPHYGYYSAHPQWHMLGRSDFPPHADLIAARDRMVSRHPGLRVVGAHLGSLEHDVAEVAARLDRYPNFAVDTSARVRDLAVQSPAAVRSFLERYSDRVLFGTDMVMTGNLGVLEPGERAGALARIEERYAAERRYFEASGVVRLIDRDVAALGLPELVLRPLFEGNARRWYPRLP
jgi:predicted TIM-barrel fold metal-dependent hydrolase